MKRRHLVEIEDLDACPKVIRDGITDYLQFITNAMNRYAPIVPRLKRALERTGSRRIVDLCSGAGGPWRSLHPTLNAALAEPIEVCLTDRYLNPKALASLSQGNPKGIGWYEGSVDATCVPGDLEGFRTLFTAFHHFRPEQARGILASAVEHGEGIAIFELTQRHVLVLLLMLLNPIGAMLAAPWIRPFRWSRMFWTWVIPAIPAALLFDGIVSCLRTYTPLELAEMTKDLGAGRYRWESGVEPLFGPSIGITYLVGDPVR